MADKSKAILQGITGAITGYGKAMGERTKIQSELLANKIELQQNWLYKMKEKMASPEYQMQQRLGQIFQQQQGGGMAGGMGGAAPQGDTFAQPVQPNVRIGKGGYEVNYPSQKEFIYSRIQQKKQRNLPLTEKEKKFEEQYLGIGRKPGYAEDVRADVQNTIGRVLSGEDYDTEIRSLKLKHPTGLSFDDLQNLKVVRDRASQLKRQATQELRNAGYPNTPANLKAAMEQLYQRSKGQ